MALSLSYGAWHTHVAYAKGGGGDASDGDDDDGGGDDDDGGKGDKGDKGGDDDDDDDGAGSDQPAVTAGGLFTMRTYPVRENSRPLTMTKGITQLRLALGTDLSAKGAFNTFGVNLEAQYGYSDNFTIIGGLTDAYNFKQFGFYFGFEGSLLYDVLDIRLAANVHRNALPEYNNFCTPAGASDPKDSLTTFHDAMSGNDYLVSTLVDPSRCAAPGAALVNLPDGTYSAGGTQFSVDIGFPFRYAFRPEIALVALQTLMSIDFNGVNNDHVISTALTLPDMATGAMIMTTINTPTRNSAKPDLKPSVGLATNPIPQLSVTVFAQLRIPDFDTQAGAFQVPVTGRIEASPSQQLDFGLEFTLLNVMPPTGQSPIDNRFLSLFMQARY
jgi:hypothetical protein